MLRRDPNVDLVSFFILRTETDEQPWNRNDLSLIPFPTYEIFEEQLRSFDLVHLPELQLRALRRRAVPAQRARLRRGRRRAGDGRRRSVVHERRLRRDRAARRAARRAAAHAARDDRRERRRLTTDTFRPRLTAEGRTHPVTSLLLDPRDNDLRWARLPPLEGINRVPRARNGATTLLTHPTLKGGDGKPAPVLVAADAGKGRALALLTDSGWNWGFMAAGEGDDGRAFQRFWENAIRWLVRDPALTLLRLELDRLEYRRNQPIAVRVRAMHADYSPAPDVEVTLTVASTAAPADREPVRILQATTGR
jgi:hypothetical protein